MQVEDDRQQVVGCFALAGTMPQGSLNPWFRQQEEGVAFPMPETACACLPEALLAVLERVLCMWEELLLPFPPPPFSSPKKRPVLQLNWIFSSSSRCLRSYLLSFFVVPSPFSGISFPQYCWVWKSVAAIKLIGGVRVVVRRIPSRAVRRVKGPHHLSPLPSPLCCLQIKITWI